MTDTMNPDGLESIAQALRLTGQYRADADSGDRMNWTADALCAQADPETFFPPKGGSTAEAKAICKGCEARAECLTEALVNRELRGVWGGTSDRERERMRRNRRRVA